jgi:hypothetical protein
MKTLHGADTVRRRSRALPGGSLSDARRVTAKKEGARGGTTGSPAPGGERYVRRLEKIEALESGIETR